MGIKVRLRRDRGSEMQTGRLLGWVQDRSRVLGRSVLAGLVSFQVSILGWNVVHRCGRRVTSQSPGLVIGMNVEAPERNCFHDGRRRLGSGVSISSTKSSSSSLTFRLEVLLKGVARGSNRALTLFADVCFPLA
jgi:hypothetical protein